MFNDTSQYLVDIFIIDNTEFEKDIPDIYQMELKLKNKYLKLYSGYEYTRPCMLNRIWV